MISGSLAFFGGVLLLKIVVHSPSNYANKIVFSSYNLLQFRLYRNCKYFPEQQESRKDLDELLRKVTSELERKGKSIDGAKKEIENGTKIMNENIQELGTLEDTINNHSNTINAMLFYIEKIILYDQILKEIKKLLEFSIHEDNNVQEQLKITYRDFALFLKTFEMEMDNAAQLTQILEKLEKELDSREEEIHKLEEYTLLLQEVEMLRDEVELIREVTESVISDIGNVTCSSTDIESKAETV